jgi:hypothetical protein
MIAADSAATFRMGNSDGEEDYETPSVDKGRRAHAEDARAGEDKDDCNCPQTKAERTSDLSERVGTLCDAGNGSEETEGVSRSMAEPTELQKSLVDEALYLRGRIVALLRLSFF